ncbi:MAG: MAPEG family protein [Pseudomonadota bacterium]
MSALVPPLLIQVALTFFILFAMGNGRLQASKTKEVRAALKEGTTPSYGRSADLLSDNLKNQFEIPVLFYAAIAVAIAADTASSLVVILAWVFALSRVVHAGIHVTVNNVRQRFLTFLFGAVVLLVLWIVLGIDLLSQ